MSNLSRRNVLSLGVALGLVSAASAAPAWASAAAGPAAPGADPWWVWDDEVDRIMAAVLEAGQVPSVNTAIRSWVNNGDPVPGGLPGGLSTYLQKVSRLPSWADLAKLRLAADFNRRKDTYLFMLYGLGSGIMSTVIPREAKSVYWSAGGADMQDRAAKTFTFGYDLSDHNGFEPAGQFVVTANKTRLVHAAVRHLLPRSPHWIAVADEPNRIPISNGDILVTFHSLGTFVHKKLREWRVPMSAQDEAAFLHSWQVAMHLLGVREEFIPRTWAAAHAQSEQVLTPVLAPTREGRELAEDLLGLTAQVDLGVTRGFLNEFVRYVLSDAIGDWLGLRRDHAAAALVRTGWPAYVAFREGLLPVMPVGFYLFDQLIRALAMLFLNKVTSPTTTPITIPTGNRPGA
ncbi:oxygenase MpaB family protein [Actinophytocola glycyrrhizae]|uniref:Oxygenase MpaB family protein n=1 Tax=Actinophytocola glycyrrhizae TaxID=2044873 RepID=A0ABV9RZ73_9PSEU